MTGKHSVLNRTCISPLPVFREHCGKEGRGMLLYEHEKVTSLMNSQQFQFSAQNRHKSEPVNVQSEKRGACRTQPAKDNSNSEEQMERGSNFFPATGNLLVVQYIAGYPCPHKSGLVKHRDSQIKH